VQSALRCRRQLHADGIDCERNEELPTESHACRGLCAAAGYDAAVTEHLRDFVVRVLPITNGSLKIHTHC
jgi:hypothetical protein